MQPRLGADDQRPALPTRWSHRAIRTSAAREEVRSCATAVAAPCHGSGAVPRCRVARGGPQPARGLHALPATPPAGGCRTTAAARQLAQHAHRTLATGWAALIEEAIRNEESCRTALREAGPRREPTRQQCLERAAAGQRNDQQDCGALLRAAAGASAASPPARRHPQSRAQVAARVRAARGGSAPVTSAACLSPHAA